jgi:HEAT repeat protein
MIALIVLLFAPDGPPKTATPLENAWSVLEFGVKESKAERRAETVHALGSLKNNARAEHLAEQALKDSNDDVRAEAASSLGRMNATSAIPALKQALDDEQIKVVLSAADALYELDDPASFDVYYAILTGQRKGSQGLLESQLARLKNRKAMEQLVFETGIGFVPFGSIGYEAWKTITRNDATIVKVAAALRLANDPDPASGRALVNACQDDKWQVRAAAANAIAKRGDTALLKVLTPLLIDENDTVRYESAASLIWLSQHPHKIRRLRH